MRNIYLYFLYFIVIFVICYARRPIEDKTKCPVVRPIRNFDIKQILNHWYVIQYFASSEEAISYRCMKAEFSMSNTDVEVTMNFSYIFLDDPLNEKLYGNITWVIPDPVQPAHWVHSEDNYESVYNTYVLDSDYISWALLLHCAEKPKTPRYLSSFIMSREPILGVNVIAFLREKLLKYDIDTSYMFDMDQDNCNATSTLPQYTIVEKLSIPVKNPLKHHHYNINNYEID